MRLWIVFFPLLLVAQPAADVQKWLDQPLLDARQGLLEAQVFTASRVPMVPTFSSSAEWDRYAARIRQDMLDKVVFRGEAKKWRAAKAGYELVETLQGNGYRVKKFRMEVIPGMWVPGVLYEPEQLTGKVPVVMNVMGHEKDGIATPYLQVRCINLAKRGMLAVNVEWLGRGQMSWDDYNHYRLAQLDLTGTSGLAMFYLHMERTLDMMLRHPNADPERVAVTGLSGGGWQTTFISALDTRVKLAMPVAGHSGFVTRAQWPELDLGDSEQTPSDMATVADYLHMSALVAPRPLLLANNAKDNCCFRADYAMGPLLQTTRNVYGLYGALDKLRYFINHAEGHNYNQDTREELYRFLRDQFKGDWDVKEIPVDNEVRTAQQLAVTLPASNETFPSVAKKLAAGLPRGEGSREELIDVVKFRTLPVDAREIRRLSENKIDTVWWRLVIGGSWTVPAVEIAPRGATDTVMIIADGGRKSQAASVAAQLALGKRVLAVDPFYIGESGIEKRDFLFAMLLAALGERPLGLQASQLAAIAKWIEKRDGRPVSMETHGVRSGLMAAVAAAIETKAIQGTVLHGSMRSLHEILEKNWTPEQYPEFFCFGLLEKFDMPRIVKLATRASITE